MDRGQPGLSKLGWYWPLGFSFFQPPLCQSGWSGMALVCPECSHLASTASVAGTASSGSWRTGVGQHWNNQRTGRRHDIPPNLKLSCLAGLLLASPGHKPTYIIGCLKVADSAARAPGGSVPQDSDSESSSNCCAGRVAMALQQVPGRSRPSRSRVSGCPVAG